jgi:hypothetical protein
MDQRSSGLQAPPSPQATIPDPSPTPASPQRPLCYELLTDLLICVMHSELSQESNHERQD